MDLNQGTARRLQEGLLKYGMPQTATSVYICLLRNGPQSAQGLLRLRAIIGDELEATVLLLKHFLLIGEQHYRDRTRFYATTPKIAWRWQEFRLVWEHVKSLVPIESIPSLDDAKASERVNLIRQLKQDAMSLYQMHPHTSIESGRGRQLHTTQEYAQVTAEAISIAKNNIVALDKPPHTKTTLPVFWAAITDRRSAGVSYTRCVPLSEVLLHGLDTVERDVAVLGIDLRIAGSQAIPKHFYLVDDKYLLAKNDIVGDGSVGQLSFGTHQLNRYRQIADRTIRRSTPVVELLGELRASITKMADEAARRHANSAHGQILLKVAARGKFSEIGVQDHLLLGDLLKDGLVELVDDNAYALAAPTDARFASFL